MKNLRFKFLLALIVSVALVSGCKDDDDNGNVSGYVGNYTISHAELAEALSVPTGVGTISLPVGTNITPMIQSSLLSAVSCTSVDKSYVELRNDNSMYLSCEFQNEVSAGTWEEVDATTLKLNMNSTAVPPNGFVLTVTDIVKNATGLRGKTSVPVPKALVAGMLPSGITLDPSAPAIFTLVFFIDFVKK